MSDDPRSPARVPAGLAVVGASAGGVEALRAFAAALPGDLGCPIIVVLHVAATGPSVMSEILARAGALPALAAADGQVLHPGRIYVAPPDRHVLVTAEGLRLSDGPRENGHRPAVDPSMRTAAQVHGPRAVGIVLSGTRDDGTAGLAAIKAAGGRVLVQDPAEALHPGMPQSALTHVPIDAVLPIVGLVRWLAQAAGGTRTEEDPPPLPDADQTTFPSDGPSDGGSRFTCPACGGVLSGDTESATFRLRCSAGHAYSPESFAPEHTRALERALWTATRTLNDRAVLLERMANRARAGGRPRSAKGFDRQTQEARRHAAVIRDSVQRLGVAVEPEGARVDEAR